MDHIRTDLGWLSQENVDWLFAMGFMTRKGGLIGGGLVFDEKRVAMYSILRSYLADMKETLEWPRGVHLSINDYISLLRVGTLEKSYSIEGENYKHILKYPNLRNVAAQYPELRVGILAKQSGKKKRSKKFI